jgi:MOSC domain-containing protein YiiM
VRLVSVNVSAGRTVDYEGRPIETGIFKEPVLGPVRVRRHGLDGDRQADLENHGGEMKAVYAYALEHYDWWRDELGRADLAPGAFGENLTIAGLDEREVTPGDEVTIGTVRLAAVQPRQPCFKLGLKLGDMGVVDRFLRSGRYGVYFRVALEGELEAGDPVEVAARVSPRFPLPDLLRLRYDPGRSPDDVRRALAVPTLSTKWRKILEGLLVTPGG